MANTLTYTATELTLPVDLQWPDEFTWTAVEQRLQYSITGALLIESATKQAGRQITLQAGADYAWMERSTLTTLRAWADVPNRVMQLVMRGAAPIDVVFDQARGAIEATPVIDYSDPSSDDVYIVTLRFLEV